MNTRTHQEHEQVAGSEQSCRGVMWSGSRGCRGSRLGVGLVSPVGSERRGDPRLASRWVRLAEVGSLSASDDHGIDEYIQHANSEEQFTSSNAGFRNPSTTQRENNNSNSMQSNSRFIPRDPASIPDTAIINHSNPTPQNCIPDTAIISRSTPTTQKLAPVIPLTLSLPLPALKTTIPHNLQNTPLSSKMDTEAYNSHFPSEPNITNPEITIVPSQPERKKSNPCSHPIRPQPNSNILKVKDLIDVTGRNWKKNIIQELFNEEEQAAILKITSLQPGEEDRLVWLCGKNGKHSAVASYDYLVNEKWKQLDIAEPSKGQAEVMKMRKRMWKLNIKGKIKHFLWKCVNNILPVNTCIAKRGIHIDAKCQLCGEEPETVYHMFFTCPKTILIWKLAPIQWDGLDLHAEKLAVVNVAVEEWLEFINVQSLRV
ncbi:Ribonuclease H-like superfamily protein [Striga hermonthica]|uniref:Ribonuclease H-like superfamily protein n=1 Tax=Striga hermonthica TaxID=68872 RepID=A0A9N7MNQ4_STRHE|nr:Ribonuclease H-like superfamily protein [Striga hermonthica]